VTYPVKYITYFGFVACTLATETDRYKSQSTTLFNDEAMIRDIVIYAKKRKRKTVMGMMSTADDEAVSLPHA
jgi:hypothetical protein